MKEREIERENRKEVSRCGENGWRRERERSKIGRKSVKLLVLFYIRM